MLRNVKERLDILRKKGVKISLWWYIMLYAVKKLLLDLINLMKEKYCLDSIVAFQTLNQSPTNRSATKQTFSFSKSPRFESIRAKYFIFYAVVPTVHTQAKKYCVKTQAQAWVLVRNMISLTKLKKHLTQESIT